MTLLELLGWFGTALYLINHAYLSLYQRYQAKWYYWGNLIAAVSLVISSTAINSWQAVLINSFWALLSLFLVLDFEIKFNRLNVRSLIFIWACAGAISSISLLFTIVNPIVIGGWLSAFIFTSSYLYFVTGVLKPRFYLLANAIAATIIMPQLWLDQNLPVFALEAAWAVISLYGAAKKFHSAHLID